MRVNRPERSEGLCVDDSGAAASEASRCDEIPGAPVLETLVRGSEPLAQREGVRRASRDRWDEIPSERKGVSSPIPASWNQIANWLTQIDNLRQAA
jgi:hypothetical protein